VVYFYLAMVLCPKTNSFGINFAIILGINLSSSVFEGDNSGWEWIWVYLMGEILGVIISKFL
jgi:glycerol uptake facilitator-like aquaporin